MGLFDNLFRKKVTTVKGDLTAIERTEVIDGFSIPGIINNMQYHAADIQVYSDGLINCWGMVDLGMFRTKINSNWVVPSIPDGQSISIFGLGMWRIEKGVWLYDKDSYYDYIMSLVKKLNPTLENLYNYNGVDYKMHGNTRISKHPMWNAVPFYCENPSDIFPTRITGKKLSVFYKDKNSIYLAQLSIFKNGYMEIANVPEKKSFDISELEHLISEGIIFSELRPGDKVSVLGLGSFTIHSGAGEDMGEKMIEILDIYSELLGSETSLGKCRRIFEEYKQKPSLRLKLELKDAYETMPKHQRIFVGDMDTKDYQVRQIIYGDLAKKEWEDYYGFEYPFDDMPQPEDE